MDNSKKIELLDRNKKIIQVVVKEINKKCPDSVDLIGIGGSFCNGDYHEKSDLDLLIIRNSDAARVLDKTFIMDDIGFDIYTKSWEDIEELANYNTPYVTKLFELGIVYFRNQEVINRIKNIQSTLKSNMENDYIISNRVGNHFRKALEAFDYLEASKTKSDSYLYFSRVIREIENAIYILNRRYVKQSIKNIPGEIKTMEILPEGFVEAYDDIVNCKNTEEMITKASNLLGIVQLYLDSIMIESEYVYEEKQPAERIPITKEILIGTYEELYSNYRGKLYHAIDINNRYLSFMAMVGAQEFFNEFTDKYLIPEIDLIGKYDPNDLIKNKDAFEEALAIWKRLYDEYGIKVENYNGLVEIESLYKYGQPIKRLL